MFVHINMVVNVFRPNFKKYIFQKKNKNELFQNKNIYGLKSNVIIVGEIGHYDAYTIFSNYF